MRLEFSFRELIKLNNTQSTHKMSLISYSSQFISKERAETLQPLFA